jgi:hypothetical protein
MSDGRVQWFGVSWGAPLNRECEPTPTPAGVPCLQCGEPIEVDDRGVTMMGFGFADRMMPGTSRVAVHIDCHLRSVLPGYTSSDWPRRKADLRAEYDFRGGTRGLRHPDADRAIAADTDLCGTCQHPAKNHLPGRCRKHGCGCGRFTAKAEAR